MALTGDDFPHGKPRGYSLGCRCPACTGAKRERDRANRDAVASLLPAEPVRRHVRWLLESGALIEGIAARSGVSRANISRLLYGGAPWPPPRRVSMDIAGPLMALRLRDCIASVPTEWGRAAEAVLVEAGWSKAAIGRAIGLKRAIRCRGEGLPIRHYEAVRKLAEDVGASFAEHDEALDALGPTECEWRALMDDLERRRAVRRTFRQLKRGSYEHMPSEQAMMRKAARLVVEGREALPEPVPVERPVTPELWRERRAEYEDLLAELTTIMRWRGENRSWLRKRACKGVDPDLFFPKRGQNATQAHALCRACPVQQECAEHAGPFLGTQAGVVGGISARERRTERSRRSA